MRWKLVLIASVLATIVGAGATLLIIFTLFDSRQTLGNSDLYVISTLLCPVAAIIYASIFVYRHTARRRPLQAILTACFAIFLTLTVLLVSSLLYARPALAPQTPPAHPNLG